MLFNLSGRLSQAHHEAVLGNRGSLKAQEGETMTLNQLLKEVYTLGFEESNDLDESFIFSVNRALNMIFTELAPILKTKVRINYGSEKSFDLREYVSAPLIITAAPKDTSGRIINGAYTDGYNVTFPEDFIGDAVISYKPAPKKLSLDSGEDEIDMPMYTYHLLPLLTAFFVFLDDDTEKADYYMGLYRSESNKLRALFSTSQDNTYTDVLGWT